MQLDVRTIFFMFGVATLAASASLFLARRVKLAVEGIGYWAWSLALGGGSGFLLARRGTVSPLISVLLGNVLVLLGCSLLWMGMRRFVGRPVRPGLLCAAPLLAAPVLVLYFLDDANVAGRISFLSVFIAGLSFLAARELLRGAEHRPLGRQWVAGILIAHAAFYVFRAIASSTGRIPADPFATGPLAMATGLEAFLFMVFLTLGLVIMTSEALQAELNRQATRDPLTDAYNRRAFHELFAKEMARTRRSGLPLSVLLMDIDHFKRLNDTHGHHLGDLALQHFVAVATHCLRQQDVLARYGGEEFIVLLPEANCEAALAIAERIRAEVAGRPLSTPQAEVGFTVSIGVADALSEGPDLQSLVNRADSALYQAKTRGRNCVVAA